MPALSVSDYGWRTASRVATILSFAFFAFSFAIWVSDVESNYLNAFGPACYFLGAGVTFLMMVRSGGALAPIAWYVLGTGVYFGLGSALWGAVPDLHADYLLKFRSGDLVRVNLLNSASILIVLLAALPFSMRTVSLPLSANSREVSWLYIYILVTPLAVISVLINFYFFPIAQDLIVRSLQSKLNLTVPMYLLLTGMLWKSLAPYHRVLAVVVVLAVLLRGVLSFSKTEVIYPLLCLLAGYWTINRSFRSLILPLIAVSVLLVSILMPMVKEGRSNASYDDAKNTLNIRAEIVSNNYERSRPRAETGNNVQALARFSHAPFQRFLIDERLAGRSGESLKDFWVALIPRILWPDKPNVTRYGSELYDLFFKTRGARSALAPTYSAEAFWNYGSLGLVVVSMLLGLQLGWLTKLWFRAIQGRRPGYLVIAFPAAFVGLNVETWIAASYLGGFVTLVTIWWLAELFIPLLRRMRAEADQF